MKTSSKPHKIVPFVVLLAAAIGLLGCGQRYTPWATNVPSNLKNLTDQQLSALNELPEQELPFTMAVMGDPQGTPKDLEKVVDEINRRGDVKFTLVLGDLTDYGLLHEYIWAGEALSRSQVPFLTVVGNHDAISHGKKIYSEMFGPFNYTFQYAGLQFVMFNNNQFEFGETDFGWLQKVADNRTIVASHIVPVIDMHSAEQIEQWQDINQSAGILSSLHGHRGSKRDFFWEEKGVPYYVVPKVSGQRYSLVTVHEDLTVTYQMCQSECGEIP